MAVTFEWDEDHGSSPTVQHNAVNVNWKSVNDYSTAYSSAPITAGSNSYEKYQYGHFSGAYNSLSAGLFAHTSGALGTGLTLKVSPTMTTDGDRKAWATPLTTNLVATTDATSVVTIASGIAIWFGATGPATVGKLATCTAALPVYTNYIVTQLLSTGSASAGDTATVTLTLQYDES